MREKLWDDEAFKERLEAAAKAKGTTVLKVLKAAGSSRYYLTKPIEGRSTNTILLLARVLGVPPAELFGVAGPTSEPQEPATANRPTDPLLDPDRLQRVTVVARMIAAQLAALVYIACNKSESDPEALMEFVVREIARDQRIDEMGGSSE